MVEGTSLASQGEEETTACPTEVRAMQQGTLVPPARLTLAALNGQAAGSPLFQTRSMRPSPYSRKRRTTLDPSSLSSPAEALPSQPLDICTPKDRPLSVGHQGCEANQVNSDSCGKAGKQATVEDADVRETVSRGMQVSEDDLGGILHDEADVRKRLSMELTMNTEGVEQTQPLWLTTGGEESSRWLFALLLSSPCGSLRGLLEGRSRASAQGFGLQALSSEATVADSNGLQRRLLQALELLMGTRLS